MTNTLLAGARVLDLSRYIAGPLSSAVLSDLGAEVTIVEPPGGSFQRQYSPTYEDGTSAFFAYYNRSKRSVTLDLKREEARSLLLRMCERVDVLVHNFPPDRAAQYQLDFASLHARAPRLIVGAVSAFGQQGPFAARRGVDGVAQALGGLVALNGREADPPTLMGSPIVDTTTGLITALGIVAALFGRERSGTGCLVDANLLESAVALTSSYTLEAEGFGVQHKPVGSRDRAGAPANVFEAADGFIYIDAEFDGVWQRLAHVLGFDLEGDEAAWRDLPGRWASVDALEEAIADWIRQLTCEQVEEQLASAQIPAGRVRTLQEVTRCPHLNHRQYFQSVGGEERVARAPLQFEGARMPSLRSWPSLGQDNKPWFEGELGLSEDELVILEESGVV